MAQFHYFLLANYTGMQRRFSLNNRKCLLRAVEHLKTDETSPALQRNGDYQIIFAVICVGNVKMLNQMIELWLTNILRISRSWSQCYKMLSQFPILASPSFFFLSFISPPRWGIRGCAFVYHCMESKPDSIALYPPGTRDKISQSQVIHSTFIM